MPQTPDAAAATGTPAPVDVRGSATADPVVPAEARAPDPSDDDLQAVLSRLRGRHDEICRILHARTNDLQAVIYERDLLVEDLQVTARAWLSAEDRLREIQTSTAQAMTALRGLL